jgi:hypothetical protein
MHAQLFHQLALARDAVQITNQQNAQQQLGINRRSVRLTVAVLQSLAHKPEVDVLLNLAQQMVLGYLIFQAK